MKTSPWFVLGVAFAAACGSAPDSSPMAGMTAEEHARMMAGGTQGGMDSVGAVLRQPVHLSAEQERALGVVYTTVSRDPVLREIRTVGEVRAPETGLSEITTKIGGWVEALAVNATGERVTRGLPLITLYSPTLVAAQEELLTAARLVAALDTSAGEGLRSARAMLEAARRRLAWWDIPEPWVAEVERSGEVQRTIILPSPVTGVVLDKPVSVGQQVTPGMVLYRVADLSTVWVEGDVFEQDLRFVRAGMDTHVEVSAYPGEHLMGRVGFIFPTLDADSRTNRVRVILPNQDGRLKPGMFATIFLDAPLGRSLMVPMSAVIITGERNLVFVRDADGMLTPRTVVLGVRAGNRVEILEGLAEGETVVRSANFLVDAESRLADTDAGMPGMQHGVTSPPDTTHTGPGAHDD